MTTADALKPKVAGTLAQSSDSRNGFFLKYKRRLTRLAGDSRWARYYLQKTIPDPKHRRQMAAVVSLFLPKPSELSRSTDAQAIAAKLKSEGRAPLAEILSQRQVTEIREYLSTKNCMDPYRPEMPGFSDPKQAHSSCLHAYFTKADIAAAPHILALANHPRVLGAVQAYFGVKPVISNIQAWWLLHGFDPAANTHDAYVCRPGEFHRDLDDYAELKLFVYLTDVDETAGPHAVIRTSHQWKLPPRQKNIELTDPAYPSVEHLDVITGPAGLAWLENALTLHRGLIPSSKDRLMVALTYTLLPIAVGPDAPLVPAGRHSFDPYINRVLVPSGR